MHLVLVRHALPERVEVVAAGADPPLTALGRRQAARLAGHLAAEPADALVVSPLARARQTAEPLAAALGRAAVVEPGLAEYDAGHHRYLPVHEMRQADDPEWRRIRDGQLPSFVDAEAFRGRVLDAVGRVVEANPGRRTAVLVCHAGVINVLLAELLGLARPLTFPLDYTGITRVRLTRAGRWVVRSVNEAQHVRGLLDPLLDQAKRK